MILKSMVVGFVILGFSGCALKQAPLMYSSKTTVGLDISTTVAENGAVLNFGFKNHDMVYIPTVVSQNDTNLSNKDINSTLLTVESTDDNNTRDTLSIFATFSSKTVGDANASMNLGIDKFVSTGMAAQNLSKAYILSNCYALTKDVNSSLKQQALEFCTKVVK